MSSRDTTQLECLSFAVISSQDIHCIHHSFNVQVVFESCTTLPELHWFRTNAYLFHILCTFR